jgi:hypothetical protein
MMLVIIVIMMLVIIVIMMLVIIVIMMLVIIVIMMLVIIVIMMYSHSLYIIIILDTFLYFTFSIPCVMVQLLRFEPRNAHNFVKVTILQHTISCTFRFSLVGNQGEHSCTYA